MADNTSRSSPLIAASAAVFRDDRVLLTVRTKQPMKGLYSLPGGKVEWGESLERAALRELEEETGIRAEILGFLNPVEILERDGQNRVRLHIVIAAYAARWVKGEVQPGPEAQDFQWIREDDLERLPTTPGLLPILRQGFVLARSHG